EALGQVYHTDVPKRMRTIIDHKPPGPGAVYEFPEVLELVDKDDRPTGIKILKARHVPVTECTLAIRCPADITVATDDPTGAVVTFAPVVEGTCPPIKVECKPASGTKFPIGTTVVTCTATDSQGNTASCTFNVTVQFIEVDHFAYSIAKIDLMLRDGSMETLTLAGPTTIHVDIGPKGEADDNDGNGLDDATTEMVQLDLTGSSPRLGPVHLRLRPATKHPLKRSTGTIEETANIVPGILNLPPFAAAGTAVSEFEVYFEIEVGGQLYHHDVPKRMRTTITHKPPGEGETYEFPEEIPLLNEQDGETGIKIVAARHTPNPPVEIDRFQNSQAQLSLAQPTGLTAVFTVDGPTVVRVKVPPDGTAADTDGDGLDQVPAEMIELTLAGISPLGDVQVMLNPERPTFGEIEEMENKTPGKLNVPPFAEGTANSRFLVFVLVKLANGVVLHNEAPILMQTTITHKPPAPGESYTNPFTAAIELFDASGNRTGFKLVKEIHTPVPPEIDLFPYSLGRFTLELPDGKTDTIVVRGRTTMAVGTSPDGWARDTDNNKLDQVPLEMTGLTLSGQSQSFGPVTVVLRSPTKHPNQRSVGEIEERKNTHTGRLDLAPFAPGGTADSFINVFFEIRVPRLDLVLHNEVPKRMRTVIAHKPPGPNEAYEDPEVIELLNEGNQRTGIKISKATHIPDPLEIDKFPHSLALLTFQLPNGQTESGRFSGDTIVKVRIPPDGTAADTDGDGKDDVPTEMEMVLEGKTSVGPVIIRTTRPARGEIEETANGLSGRLDISPFAGQGTADSFFDVPFEVQVGDTVYHTANPLRMASEITHKPPRPRDRYENPFTEPIELLTASGDPTGFKLVREIHVPNTRVVPERKPHPTLPNRIVVELTCPPEVDIEESDNVAGGFRPATGVVDEPNQRRLTVDPQADGRMRFYRSILRR
ncbi:MAG: HYR domain-containing protein, partial [Verrucomicrobia bacterium]|nr:HYR domain-containing protein [Verrucomicrobiota bacterium]